MKIKTSELTGIALDWAVAYCEELTQKRKDEVYWLPCLVSHAHYSTDWSLAGPIIEREHLCVGTKHQADPIYCPVNDLSTNCWTRTTAGGYLSHGPALLVAAMRCYVASKLGNEVNVPDELVSRSRNEV